MLNNCVLHLKNVSKFYDTHNRHAGSRQIVTALDNITLNFFEEEIVAIIGPNGSGKTTLLRAIGGTLTIDEGLIKRRFPPRTIIELTQNLIHEASGLDNIYYFGSILGLPKSSLQKHLSAIIDFAGLGAVITEPVGHYSNGMRMKLAFSIATIGQPKIICLDEIIAVGDKNFYQKSYARFLQLQAQKATVILATHSLDMARKFATRAIYLKDGRVIADGPAKKVVQIYRND